MDWRQYLLLLASGGVLIGLAMGLHYGHMHREVTTAEPAAVEATAEIPPWPATLKAQMIESCVEYSGADLEQCKCTFDWYEQHASLGNYLEWSGVMASGLPLSDEANQLFHQAGIECSRLEIVTPAAQ